MVTMILEIPTAKLITGGFTLRTPMSRTLVFMWTRVVTATIGSMCILPTVFNSPVSSIYGSYYGAYAISRNGIVGQFEHEIVDKIDNSYGPFPVI